MTIGESPPPETFRRLAVSLARAAGEVAAEGRRAQGTGRVPHETKSTETDPVTEHDRAAERLLVERLGAERPDDAIVGEEGAARAGTSGLEWHLDPIDGTVNFLYGIGAWSTSVGVVDAHGGVAGAVFAPMLGEMYSAARGGGATLNDVPIHASTATELSTSLVASGFSYDREVRRQQAERLVTVVTATRDVRRGGSAALDLCAVAAARVDAYFEEQLNSWDVAAGMLIATEAGATVTDYDGTPVRPGRVLAAAPGIHGELVDLLVRTPLRGR